jgi:hypothetical protein
MPDTTRTITGYAWLVSPEAPQRPGIAGPPLATEDPSGWPGFPGNILVWRPLSEGDRGIPNRPAGKVILVITDSPISPEVREGWRVIPADFSSDFHIEGDGLRLRRGLGAVGISAPGNPLNDVKVLQCEFDVKE